MTDVEGYGPTSYGDGFADVYDRWYAEVSSPEDTADFVASRVSGLVVELGSGTGRLAAPLRSRGIPVVGLDASEAMLRRSVARDPGVAVVAADMAKQPFRPASASGVLIAFNTLFNLPTAALQREALAGATSLVAPDGPVVVEAFVPAGAEDAVASGTVEDHIDVVRLEADAVVLRVSRTDPAAQTVSGHHVELRHGQPVRLRPWHLRFAGPAELDALAADAGLVLSERFADWTEAPFDDDSGAHVSVYRPAEHRR